jgi:hypothetical protein
MRTKVIVAVAMAAGVLAFADGGTSARAGSQVDSLSSAQRRAIVHAPHPYLDEVCWGQPIGIVAARRTTIGRHRVIVAQASCRYGTTGSPQDTAVYGKRSRHWTQLYRLDSGRSIERTHVTIASISFSVRGQRVVVRFGGFQRADPVCCPSRKYHRVYHLRWRGFTRGDLIRDR